MFNHVAYGPAPVQPLESWLHTVASPHIWTADLPQNLTAGSHTVTIYVKDKNQKLFIKDKKVFEITE